MANSTTGGAGANLVLFLSLVPYVMDHGEVSVDEAAAQFDRTPDDIRRAIELIACAGIPGDSTAYLHTDLFDIDWDLFEQDDIIRFEHTIAIDREPRLSNRELSALIAGLQYIAAHPSYGAREDIQSLLAKLRGSHKGGGESLVISDQDATNTRSVVAQAIASGHQVSFDYVSRSEDRETRTVDPIALEARDGTWYMRGWCHTRQALRMFRLDRMSELIMLGAASQAHPDLDSVDSWEVFTPSDADLRVTIAFSRHALPVIAEYLDRAHPPTEEGDRLIAEIPFAHTSSLMRFVSANAGLVEVIAPTSARLAVLAWAESAKASLQ